MDTTLFAISLQQGWSSTALVSVLVGGTAIMLVLVDRGRRQGKYGNGVIAVEWIVGLLLCVCLILLADTVYHISTGDYLIRPGF